MSNAGIAAIIGRPDLAGAPIDPYGGTSGNPQVTALGAQLGMNVGDVAASGKLTAGILGLAVIGLVAFYVWTRDIQA